MPDESRIEDAGMAETIIVRCSSCGEENGQISYIRGEIGQISCVPVSQLVGCSKCEKRTVVEISKNGHVDTKGYWGDE